MKKEKILLKVRRSRKSYFAYYSLLLIVSFLSAYFYLNGLLEGKFLWILLVFVIIVLKTIEIHRIRDWWAITDTSFIESKSIFNKNVREIDFQTIADVDLEQEWYKRIFGYGTINIRKFLNEKCIVIENINKPEKFINLLNDAIRKREKR